MIKKLEEQKVNMVKALSEGIILRACNDVLHGKEHPIKLLGSYTQSPLCWSIAVSPKCTYTSKKDLMGRRIGISRFGSGSHIMAIVMALLNGWIDFPFEFVVLNDIRGLLNGIANDTIDAFLWEVITTKV